MFRLCIIMRADNNDRGENVLVHNSNKRFSVGLNLSDEEDTIIAFLDKYCDYLTSVYFSLPLGLPYYSRKALIQEYESSENQEKLLRVCSYMKKLGIHREAAINKSNMTCSEIEQGIKYLKTYLPDVEEIVCLQEYARTLKEAFPHAELKYSFNNMTIRFDHTFDTYVLGKRYLRDMERRHEVLGQGFEVVLLLGLDPSVLPKRQRKKLTGLLTDMESNMKRIVACSPESWIINTRNIDVLADEQNLATHNVNWKAGFDGSFTCGLGHGSSIVITPVNELGLCTAYYIDNKNKLKGYFGKDIPLQTAFDRAYDYLIRFQISSRKLWDMGLVANGWGADPASQKQLGLIKNIFQSRAGREKYQREDFDYTNLTKYEASIILDRILGKGE